MTDTTVFAAGTVLAFELGAPDSFGNDLLRVADGFTLDSTLNVTAPTGFGAGRYDLIDCTGTFTNNTLNIGTAPTGCTYAIDLTTSGK